MANCCSRRALGDAGPAQQTIAKIAILAPQQTTTIIVNGYTDDTPAPGAEAPGCYVQPHPVAERADNVMQFMISQGVSRTWLRRKDLRRQPARV